MYIKLTKYILMAFFLFLASQLIVSDVLQAVVSHKEMYIRAAIFAPLFSGLLIFLERKRKKTSS